MPITNEDRKAIRARHWAVSLGSASICGRCQGIWPCDADRLLAVVTEAVNFTAVWRETFPYLPDDYGCWLQCVEAESAAGLYRVLGDEGMAEVILDNHAAHDTEEEDHWERGQRVRDRRAARAAGG